MKYGSNHLRKKLNYIPQMDQSAGRLQEPIIRGKGFKERGKGQKSQEISIKKNLKKG